MKITAEHHTSIDHVTFDHDATAATLQGTQLALVNDPFNSAITEVTFDSCLATVTTPSVNVVKVELETPRVEGEEVTFINSPLSTVVDGRTAVVTMALTDGVEGVRIVGYGTRVFEHDGTRCRPSVVVECVGCWVMPGVDVVGSSFGFGIVKGGEVRMFYSESMEVIAQWVAVLGRVLGEKGREGGERVSQHVYEVLRTDGRLENYEVSVNVVEGGRKVDVVLEKQGRAGRGAVEKAMSGKAQYDIVSSTASGMSMPYKYSKSLDRKKMRKESVARPPATSPRPPVRQVEKVVEVAAVATPEPSDDEAQFVHSQPVATVKPVAVVVQQGAKPVLYVHSASGTTPDYGAGIPPPPPPATPTQSEFATAAGIGEPVEGVAVVEDGEMEEPKEEGGETTVPEHEAIEETKPEPVSERVPEPTPAPTPSPVPAPAPVPVSVPVALVPATGTRTGLMSYLNSSRLFTLTVPTYNLVDLEDEAVNVPPVMTYEGGAVSLAGRVEQVENSEGVFVVVVAVGDSGDVVELVPEGEDQEEACDEWLEVIDDVKIAWKAFEKKRVKLRELRKE